MPLYTVEVTERQLVTYEVEADSPEQARNRYRSSGIRVHEEPGEDAITGAVRSGE